MIVRKLECYRESGAEKHVRDVVGILALISSIDLAWIESTVERVGLLQVRQEVRNKDREGQG